MTLQGHKCVMFAKNVLLLPDSHIAVSHSDKFMHDRVGCSFRSSISQFLLTMKKFNFTIEQLIKTYDACRLSGTKVS